MAILNKPYYKVERMCSPGIDTSWYETMMSPFKTFEEALEDIKNNSQHYPLEHQNYKITYQP